MSKTQKRGAGGPHNPSPYMRRFQLPSLTFKDSTDYDELLSPLETEAKQQLMDEKNSQLRNYFADSIGTSSNGISKMAQKEPHSHQQKEPHSSNGFRTTTTTKIDSESKLYEDPFEPHSIDFHLLRKKKLPESQSFEHKKSVSNVETTTTTNVPSKVVADVPPPIPPHRPNPRQKIVEIEKYRMCKEILELERRSREMMDKGHLWILIRDQEP
uniref:Uncharacterized protein n=1 Tax=Panagrolaimus superbus TaxID=310955 RepID=A0A914Z4J8_9BILA